MIYNIVTTTGPGTLQSKTKYTKADTINFVLQFIREHPSAVISVNVGPPRSRNLIFARADNKTQINELGAPIYQIDSMPNHNRVRIERVEKESVTNFVEVYVNEFPNTEIVVSLLDKVLFAREHGKTTVNKLK